MVGGRGVCVQRLWTSVEVGDSPPLEAFLRVTVLHRVRISWARGLGGTLGVVGPLKRFGSDTLGIILLVVGLR